VFTDWVLIERGAFSLAANRDAKRTFLLLLEAADRGLRKPEWNLEDGKANLIEVRDAILDYVHKV